MSVGLTREQQPSLTSAACVVRLCSLWLRLPSSTAAQQHSSTAALPTHPYMHSALLPRCSFTYSDGSADSFQISLLSKTSNPQSFTPRLAHWPHGKKFAYFFAFWPSTRRSQLLAATDFTSAVSAIIGPGC